MPLDPPGPLWSPAFDAELRAAGVPHAEAEWLLAVSTPSRWTAGKLEYELADTPQHWQRLKRLGSVPALAMDGPHREQREPHPDPGPAASPAVSGRSSTGPHSSVTGSCYAPTRGPVQQVDVRIPGEVGYRLAAMLVHALDGDYDLVRLAGQVFTDARTRGRADTAKAVVADTALGRRLLTGLRQVGLDRDVLNPARTGPTFEPGGGLTEAAWTFSVQRSTCELHALMLSAAAARGAARAAGTLLPTPPRPTTQIPGWQHPRSGPPPTPPGKPQISLF